MLIFLFVLFKMFIWLFMKGISMELVNGIIIILCNNEFKVFKFGCVIFDF